MSESIPETMKAIVVKETGGLDALTLDPAYPVPKVGVFQVLIKNEYAGLNFIDTYYRSGLYKKACPFVSGQEGGGVVVAIGSKVSNIQLGDKVVYIALVGSYCEYSAVPATKAVKIPASITMEKALACMVQGLTAHYLVTDASAGLIQKDEWCLIYSVGSGTCQWAAQMAKLQGYKVIGTTSKTKADIAPKAACDHLLVLDTAEGKTYADYESVDIHQKVMEWTNGQGVKCILDGVGRSTSDISIKCLGRRGIWISFGNASGAVPPVSISKFTPKSAFCTRPKLGDYIATREELDQRAQQVFQWMSEGKLDVKVDKVFPLENAKEGHSYLEAGQSKGKVLFRLFSNI
jgi:NADPH2:quinone reductase